MEVGKGIPPLRNAGRGLGGGGQEVVMKTRLINFKNGWLLLGLTAIALVAVAEEFNQPKRYGMVLGVKEDKIDEYKELHADVWPEVLEMIKECNIQNYSIFLRKLPDGKHYLFSYFEYTGDDFAGDMAKMAADPTTQKWWDVCEPLQVPFEDRAEGEWWTAMEEVFHLD